MTYKCIRTCYNKRLYEEGRIYDSIGAASPKFFEEVNVAKDTPVVETGFVEPGPSEPPDGKSERDQIKEALTELEVEFKGNASTDSLKEMLLDAQSNALLS